MSDYRIEDVVQKYIELRDKKAAAKAKYDAYVADIETKLDRLDAWLLKTLEASGGVTSFNTPYGTVYTQTRVKCSGSDWSATWNYIKENDRFDLMEKRISSKAAQEIFEQTGAYPPGINVFTERQVVVRRA